MSQLYTFHTSRIYFAFILLVGLTLSNFSARAQCWENFYVYQLYPYGQLCSPQNVTLRAEYFNDYGTYVSGEFRWYTSDTDPNPVHTDYIYSDFGQLTSDYTLYANNGTTIWVSFYNYNTGCESYRSPYTFYISPSAYLYQDYATKCRDDVAKVQLSSNISGVTYQLFKLYEYYDPWYGWVQDYQYQGSNSTGYFDIYDFDPVQDQYKYFAKVYQPYGCSVPYYYQLYFDITEATPRSVTGDLTVASGSSTTLTAGGNASNYNWYDASGNLIYTGWQFTTPATLTPNTYVYGVRGVNSTGTCLSDPASVTVTVTLPSVTYTPLYNSSNFIKTIDLSKPVGTVSGGAGTTASGGITYSIPIYTPPGTNGVQPSVSITYSSQSGNGNVGFGWNIGGLSAISRTGKNIYHNGIVAPVGYTSDDAFVLDGMRLNPITGTNGANGTVYAGEVETFSKIISNTSASANNPDWFQVIAKDGSIMEFGKSSDSRVLSEEGANVMLWRLNRLIDINGNYIDFIYKNDYHRDSHIDKIKYTGNINTSLAPYNSINFNYKIRSDKNKIFDGTSSLSSDLLLDKIVVTADDNSIAKQYQFNYGFDNVTSLLKEIVETGSDGSSLNSTIFLYGDQPQAINTQTIPEFVGETAAGDFNGDGISDILATTYYYNQGIRYNSSYKIITNPATGSSLYEKSLPEGHIVVDDKKFVNFLSSDFNMDGRDDVLLVKTSAETYPSGNTRRLVDRFTVVYSTNTGNTETTFPMSSYKYIHSNGNFFVPGDFDGDGNRDYICFLAHSSGGYRGLFTSPSKFILNQIIGNFTITAGIDAISIAEADKILPFDFNGDGKQELLITKGSQTYILSIEPTTSPSGYTASIIHTTAEISSGSKTFPGDFNGDAKTDFLVRNANGSWKILYSTGAYFVSVPFTFNQSVNITNTYSDDKIIIADFNGDGKTDILHGYSYFENGVASTSRLSLYYSKGCCSSFYYEQYTYNAVLPYIDLTIGDFNGDGRSDILSKNSYTSAADFIYLKPNGKERMLVKVTDGHNVTNSFNYKLLTDKSSVPYVYSRTVSLDDPANLSGFNHVQLPLYVLSSISSPNGIGGENTTSFSYEDAILHRNGKGFLGFKKIISNQLTAGTTSVTENEINAQFAVPYSVRQTTSLTSTAELLSELQITNSFVDLSTSSVNKRYFQKVDKVLTINNLSGTASETVSSYDAYGNVTTSISKVGTPSGSTVNPVETTTTTAAYSIHNTPVPSKPDNTTVSNERAGMGAQNTTTQFAYTTNGLLASETGFAGLPKAVTTSYSYNGFGNATTITTSATGVNNRTSNLSYDSKGRFVITTQAGAGTSIAQTGSTAYESKWGKPLTTTSSDCITTSFEYDGFGRLKKTNLPEGFSVNTSFVWDVQGQNVFYSYTDYPGGKPDVKTWMDIAGRETKQQVAGFNNQWLTKLTTYNVKGNVATQTNPYYPSESPIITTNSYDVYNRLQVVTNVLNTASYEYFVLGDGKMQITTSSAGQITSKTTDATGKVITSTDKGGNLDFTYDSRGNQVEVKHGSTVLITNGYDAYGRQIILTDKNAGTVTYDYDAFGQLKQQTDNASQTYTMTYDDLGRLLTRQGPEGTTTNQYYNDNAGCSNNNLTKVIGFNGVEKEYTYDILQRLQTEKLTIDANNIYLTQYGYDTYGQLTSTTYPSGVVVANNYDNNGGLQTVSGGSAGNMTALFTATAINGFGQYTGFTLGNGKVSTHTYTNGLPTRFYTQGVQDLNFSFDAARGNLLSRADALKGKTETFGFDDLNRLTSTTVNGVLQQSLSYDGTTNFSMGNIMAKTDAGNYVYNNNKIHAVAYITNTAGSNPDRPVTNGIEKQDITYTPFLKTATINEDTYNLAYTYRPDYQRVKSELKFNGAVTETKYYAGAYEKQTDNNGTREIHYVGGGDGLCAMIIREGGTNQFYFVYKDHLGSLLTLTDIGGNIIAEQNFDAWGRKRNPTTWDYVAIPSVPAWLYRGYTGHEHLEQFALINMNGRMYDPVQGRMLSPDNYVSTPFGTQGYNRYSYAMNNPLSYTDPDGNNPLLIAALIIGAYTGGTIANGGQLNPIQWNWRSGQTWGGILGGAIIGGASAGLGIAVSSALGTSIVSAYAGLIATSIGGLSAGMFSGFGFSAMAGGNPIDGLWKGGLSGMIGGGIGAYISGGLGAIAGGASSGFASSLLNGSNIGQAFKAALISGGSSWGFYQFNAAINYKKVAAIYRGQGQNLTRSQYNIISRSAQKSFVTGKEYGGWLTKEGGVEMWPVGGKHEINATPRSGNEVSSFHTHPHYVGFAEYHSPIMPGGQLDPRTGLSSTLSLNDIGTDIAWGQSSTVVGWKNIYFHNVVTNQQVSMSIGSSLYFNPYPYNPYFSHY